MGKVPRCVEVVNAKLDQVNAQVATLERSYGPEVAALNSCLVCYADQGSLCAAFCVLTARGLQGVLGMLPACCFSFCATSSPYKKMARKCAATTPTP